MRNVLLFLAFASAMLVERARAEIVFSITPSTSSIILGDSAVFNIFIQSATPEVIGGYTMNVVAGPMDVTGVGGRFTSGTFSFLVGVPNQDWSFARVGQAFSTAFTGAAGGTGSGQAIAANTVVPFGSLTLSTVGATLGTYQLTVSTLSAVGVNNNFLPNGTNGINGAFFSGPVSYTIAVPEPSSLALLGLGSLGFAWLRKRKVVRLLY